MLATLAKLQENKITPEMAYKEIYSKTRIKRIPFSKRAHFIKLNINVPEEKGANRFLKALFFMPFPIMLLRVMIGFINFDKYTENVPLSKREILRLISYKGIKIKVNSNSGEKILIKTI